MKSKEASYNVEAAINNHVSRQKIIFTYARTVIY